MEPVGHREGAAKEPVDLVAAVGEGSIVAWTPAGGEDLGPSQDVNLRPCIGFAEGRFTARLRAPGSLPSAPPAPRKRLFLVVELRVLHLEGSVDVS